MKKSYVYAIVAVVILAAVGGVWYALAHKNSNKTNTNSNSTSMNMNSSSSSSSSSAVATNSVTIQNFSFSPASITVKKGTKVTWTNKDSVTHTVTETDGQQGPDSGDLSPGSSYSFTFATAGTYHYHCSIHTEMTGTVTVTN